MRLLESTDHRCYDCVAGFSGDQMLRKLLVLFPVLFFSLLSFQIFADTASDELLAAFTKLKDLKSYRTRMTLTPTGNTLQQMQQAKSMGFELKPILSEVVNPDTHKITMVIPLMSMGSMPKMPSPQEMQHMSQEQMQQMAQQMQQMQQGGPQMPKMVQVPMYAVTNGNHVATYLDCVECEKKIDDSMKEQLKKIEESMATNLLKNLLSGPTGWIGAGVQAASDAAEMAAMPKLTKKVEEEMSLNRWKCRERKEGASATKSDASFPNAKALGTEKVGTEDAKTYQFDVTDQNTQQTMPVKLYVSASSGLPMKMEMTMQQGTMTMEMYDLNAPINIDLPDCMKK